MIEYYKTSMAEAIAAALLGDENGRSFEATRDIVRRALDAYWADKEALVLEPEDVEVRLEDLAADSDTPETWDFTDAEVRLAMSRAFARFSESFPCGDVITEECRGLRETEKGA